MAVPSKQMLALIYAAGPKCEWSGHPLRDIVSWEPSTRKALGRCPVCDGPVWSLPLPIAQMEPPKPI